MVGKNQYDDNIVIDNFLKLCFLVGLCRMNSSLSNKRKYSSQHTSLPKHPLPDPFHQDQPTILENKSEDEQSPDKNIKVAHRNNSLYSMGQHGNNQLGKRNK